MTPKQKRFCDEYLIDLNATQAAIRAGYSKKTAGVIGPENLAKPYIKSYIEERLKQIEDAKIADVDEVMKYLTSVLRGESRATVISDGQTVMKNPDEKERLKAAELLGKRYGAFTDRVQNEIILPVFGGEETLED